MQRTQPTVFSNKQEINNLPNKISTHQKHTEDELLIVIFYGVSALGKTTFSRMISQLCKKDEIGYKSTSFDEFAPDVIKTFKEDNPEIVDSEDIFFGCWAKITALFHQNIFEAIEKCKGGKNILMVDDGKIDPKLLRKLCSTSLKPSHRLKRIAIYPKTQDHFEIGEAKKIPFSAQLLYNLCMRSLIREKHETVDYDDTKTLQVILSFTLLYQNIASFSSFADEADYTEMIEVPFHQEKEIADLEVLAEFENFKKLIKAALNAIKAPFESLKTSDTTHLEALGQYLREQTTQNKLEEYLSFGKKEDWIHAWKTLENHFGIEEASKENDINRSN